jgi:KipI family sensor histidine kinase inhibitor
MRRTLACGVHAVLVECDDSSDALALWRRLDADPPEGVEETVPGARTVLVVGRTDERFRTMLTALPGLAAPPDEEGTQVVIPVRYDGVDLGAVAAVCGLEPEQVAERHSAAAYTAAFGGFVPGFAYLTGVDSALRLPRRNTPRTRVAAGSVAIAEDYTAVYPSNTPGGWHIIGSTDVVMFDPHREPAATLRPGIRVRFERAG